MYGINTVVGLISVGLFPSLTKKFNRKRLFYLCLTVMLTGIIVFSLASGSLVVSLIGAELFFIPQPLAFLVVLMIISDAVEYGQLKTGHRDEALTLSVRPLVDKLGGAMSNWFVSLVAVMAGMTTGATAQSITSHGRMIFKLCMFGFPALMLIIAGIVFAKKVLLTEKKHAEIVDKLEQIFSKEHADANIKENIQFELSSPLNGELIDLKDVPDQTFASLAMGKGFAVKPHSGKIYAPISGVVRTIAPTRHSIAIEDEDGVIVLIHIGIGTVQLKGTGFISYVEDGARVKKGEQILEFWDPVLTKNGIDDTVMVTVVNAKRFNRIDYLVNYGKNISKLQLVAVLGRENNEK